MRQFIKKYIATAFTALVCFGLFGQISPVQDHNVVPVKDRYFTDLSQQNEILSFLMTRDPVRYTSNPIGITTDCLMRNVIKVGDTYHLFEEQEVGGNPPWSISKRTSTDGLHWSLESGSLFSLGATGRFDQNGQADPTVIYDGVNDWKMWYDALNGASNWDSLGYATSTDGTTWTKYGHILKRGTSGQWDDAFIHHPEVIKNGNTYFMYYAGSRSQSTNYKIGLATSTDGINWTKYAGNPILSYGAGGSWDANYIRPNRTFILSGTWYMFYWGYNGTNWNVGLATSPNGYTWTDKGKYWGKNSGGADIKDITTLDVINENGLLKIWYSTQLGGITNSALNFASIDILHSGDKNIAVLDTVPVFVPASVSSVGDSATLNSVTVRAANYIYFFKVAISGSMTPDGMNLYIYALDKPTISGTIKMCLYTDVAGKPSSPVSNGSTNEKQWSAVLGNSWNLFDFTVKPTLSAGSYWMAFWSTTAFKSGQDAGGSANMTNYSSAYGSWPTGITGLTTYGYNNIDCYLVSKRTNVWRTDLTSEPAAIYFNGSIGNKQTSIPSVDSGKDWFWVANRLYIYSMTDPNVNYQIGKLK